MIGAPPKSAVSAQRAALEAARRRTALQVDTLAHAVVDMDDAVGWARLTELGTRSTVVAQESAVSATADLLNATLNAADLVGDIASLPGIQPGRLASGNDVRGMFAATRDIVARRMTAPDVTFPMALDASASKLVAIASSEPHRIGRDGQLAVGLSDERFNRYRRVAVGNTCTFCLMLATRGAVYLTAASAGQSRKYHTNCVPADTLVRSPGTEAATRRWYEGELVVVATTSGKQLRITPNHPVLTDHGWVDAGSLKVGDHVVDGSRLDWQRLGVPNVDDAPALIGDVFQAIRMCGDAVRVESSPEDFYGDGRDGNVDVVRPYGLLDHDLVSALSERIADQSLALGWRLGGAPLPRQGGRGEAFGAELGASHGGMSGRRALRSILGSHGRCAYHRRLGSASYPNPAVAQFGEQCAAGHAVTTSDGQSGLAAHVLLDGLVGHIQSSRTAAGRAAARFDPMSAHQDWDHVRAYAQKGADLLVRVAGQIALDPVVDVRRVQWSGHVFDLQTVEGWFVADGLMVSNCDCYVALVVDQDAIARSKSLQGDWRNAIRDEQRMREAGALRGIGGMPDDFVRQQVTREAVEELAARAAFDAANPTGVTAEAADLIASGGWAPGKWVEVSADEALFGSLPESVAAVERREQELAAKFDALRAKPKNKSRPVVHAMANGNKTIVSEQALNPAQLAGLLADFDEAIAAMPDDLRRRGVSLMVPVGDPHFRSGAGGYVMGGTPRIHIKPAIAKGTETWDNPEMGVVDGIAYGHHMPASVAARTRRDVVMHEMGHVVDDMKQHTGATGSKIFGPKWSEEAFWTQNVARLPARMYAQKNAAEGYAEAFMQYHIGGPGSTPMSDAYAARYGW